MALTWADKRRFYIIGGFSLIGVVLLSAVVFAVVYETPSCMDGRQNQDERGVDCGGSCAFLCSADVEEPRVTFARAVENGNGRTDVIAYIENRNQQAEANSAQYTVEVFDDAGRLLGTREGTIDLPSRSTVPLFIPGMFQGVGANPRAFVTFDENIRWRNVRGGEVVLSATNVELTAGTMPRVQATVRNPAPAPVYNHTLIATVFDAEGVAIAASQTVVREVEGLGSGEAVFTWSGVFNGTPVRAEVRGVPMLP